MVCVCVCACVCVCVCVCVCACVCVCVCVCVHYASTLKVVKVFRSPLANIPEDQLHNTWIKHSHTQGFFKLMNKKNPNKRDQFHREMLYFSENISVANISRSNTSAQHTRQRVSQVSHMQKQAPSSRSYLPCGMYKLPFNMQTKKRLVTTSNKNGTRFSYLAPTLPLLTFTLCVHIG